MQWRSDESLITGATPRLTDGLIDPRRNGLSRLLCIHSSRFVHIQGVTRTPGLCRRVGESPVPGASFSCENSHDK